MAHRADDETGNDWHGLALFPRIISAVTHPLGLYTLIVLLVSVPVVASTMWVERGFDIILAVILFDAVAIAILTVVLVTFPEVFGVDPIREEHGADLAHTIYEAMDGYLQNSPRSERASAWEYFVAEIGTPTKSRNKGYRLIRSSMAAAMQSKLESLRRSPTPIGVVRADPVEQEPRDTP